ncbi:ead/Ea22-like family protein [Serratia quinivorans]|uniref:ead/Ea22-like family protein n=1 Tax=Serratia quinivorans TaxID=137545 RepID=UPI0039828957
MDKFSGLKAIAEKAKELGGINNYKKGKDAVAAFIAAATPAAILALLAELEASKQYAKERDAENESLALTVGRLRVELHNEGAANAHAYERIRELEKRLATPVRLPDVLFIKVSGSAVPVMHAERVKERVQAAGFKCVGDE